MHGYNCGQEGYQLAGKEQNVTERLAEEREFRENRTGWDGI